MGSAVSQQFYNMPSLYMPVIKYPYSSSSLLLSSSSTSVAASSPSNTSFDPPHSVPSCPPPAPPALDDIEILGGWQGPSTASIVFVSSVSVLSGIGVGFMTAWSTAGGGKLGADEKQRLNDGARLASKALLYGTLLTATAGMLGVFGVRQYFDVHSWPQFADKCEEIVTEKSIIIKAYVQSPIAFIEKISKKMFNNKLNSIENSIVYDKKEENERD